MSNVSSCTLAQCGSTNSSVVYEFLRRASTMNSNNMIGINDSSIYHVNKTRNKGETNDDPYAMYAEGFLKKDQTNLMWNPAIGENHRTVQITLNADDFASNQMNKKSDSVVSIVQYITQRAGENQYSYELAFRRSGGSNGIKHFAIKGKLYQPTQNDLRKPYESSINHSRDFHHMSVAIKTYLETAKETFLKGENENLVILEFYETAIGTYLLIVNFGLKNGNPKIATIGDDDDIDRFNTDPSSFREPIRFGIKGKYYRRFLELLSISNDGYLNLYFKQGYYLKIVAPISCYGENRIYLAPFQSSGQTAASYVQANHSHTTNGAYANYYNNTVAYNYGTVGTLGGNHNTTPTYNNSSNNGLTIDAATAMLHDSTNDLTMVPKTPLSAVDSQTIV